LTSIIFIIEKASSKILPIETRKPTTLSIKAKAQGKSPLKKHHKDCHKKAQAHTNG
jgi:hypothetical protein